MEVDNELEQPRHFDRRRLVAGGDQWWIPIPKWIIVVTFALGLVLMRG
jgi:hypothetical protein